ncbi:Docking protein 3 [Paragonimus westermani]|uniref:Docking protein 3 n=1 Tax=Paragonimus westermani TaxID=34504 RepID=A0A8T0D4G3_9TREM|nr:Docking protein 3 [Paragonimus westermani]
MKRLYLITGSGCEGGKGLFIFLVHEATSLHNRLLLLTRHIESSAVLSRGSQHIPVLPTSPTADVREFNDTLQSTGYWIQPDSFVRAPLASPLSVAQQEACNMEQTSLGARSIQKRMPTPKGTPPVSVTAYDFGHPTSYSTDVSREMRLINNKCCSEGYSQTSADSNNTSCHEDFTMPEGSDLIFVNGAQVEQVGKPVEVNTVDYNVEENQSQPVYANAEELTKCIQNGDPEPSTDCLSSERRLSSEDSLVTRNSSPDPGCEDGSLRKFSRPWMFAHMFEPIEESEEHVSRSNSDSTVKARDDSHPLVTSSTPGDEDVLEDDDLFNEDNHNAYSNEENGNESAILKHADSISKCRRPVARSATWDGWMNGRSKKQVDSRQITKDVTVQTETDDDSIDSGSDTIIRTVL